MNRLSLRNNRLKFKIAGKTDKVSSCRLNFFMPGYRNQKRSPSVVFVEESDGVISSIPEGICRFHLMHSKRQRGCSGVLAERGCEGSQPTLPKNLPDHCEYE
jgi:hypothetical protein